MTREELYLKIQQLGFAKAEAELFLDTHPTCKYALDYFHKIVRELDTAMTEYQNKYGALTTDGVTNTDRSCGPRFPTSPPICPAAARIPSLR